jgi:hypothetical protein
LFAEDTFSCLADEYLFLGRKWEKDQTFYGL